MWYVIFMLLILTHQIFFIDVIEKIASLGNKNKLIGGDFNLVMNPEMGRFGISGINERLLSILNLYLEEAELGGLESLQPRKEILFMVSIFPTAKFH